VLEFPLEEDEEEEEEEEEAVEELFPPSSISAAGAMINPINKGIPGMGDGMDG